jgi:hypothetical protein
MSIVTSETTIPIEDPVKPNQPKMNDDNFLPNGLSDRIDIKRVRYPHCLVWTPIPVLTWLFPFIGHMGIARTDGVIRDFAGPYYVSVSTNHFTNKSNEFNLYLGR